MQVEAKFELRNGMSKSHPFIISYNRYIEIETQITIWSISQLWRKRRWTVGLKFSLAILRFTANLYHFSIKIDCRACLYWSNHIGPRALHHRWCKNVCTICIEYNFLNVLNPDISIIVICRVKKYSFCK